MTELIIRRATPADEAAIVELQRVSLGEGVIPRSPEFWRWKHVDNPFGPSPVLVAEADGALVGLRAFMCWRWRTGGREAPAVRAVDTATHPDWRGRGIFKRLTVRLRDQMAAEGVVFVYNTPNEQSRPGYLKMGWQAVGRPTLWIRPVRPLRAVGALLREGLGGEEGEPPAVDAESAGAVLEQSGAASIVEAAASVTHAAYHTTPSLDFLRWRYAGIPGIEYFGLRQGDGETGALLLLRSRRRGALRELRVCDIVVGPTTAARRSARSLLRDAAGRADVSMVVARPPAGHGFRLLVGAGFLPAPGSGPILTAYPLADGWPAPETLASWSASVGDLELF